MSEVISELLCRHSEEKGIFKVTVKHKNNYFAMRLAVVYVTEKL
jgi:hypothetical protein